MRFVYRAYLPDDLEPLQGLMLELGYDVEASELQNNIGEITNKGGEIIIAEQDGEAVGSICVLLDARLAEGVCAEIVSLVVTEKARGKGIGRQLVKEAIIWAGKHVDKIRVRANEVRSAAHAFYKGQGFKEIKTQKIFIKKL